ncbi:hypothetical protein EVAR_6095_1 [Eumeta japonica]|uniref:Uncharacterized protein n=1 Tax=Eumeta variegata TaxID=151549 RepID=A0A4C1TE64_EUMVA|nr:hypothetical protein EVAR_6095_1 [Eumeta japonica]
MAMYLLPLAPLYEHTRTSRSHYPLSPRGVSATPTELTRRAPNARLAFLTARIQNLKSMLLTVEGNLTAASTTGARENNPSSEQLVFKI